MATRHQVRQSVITLLYAHDIGNDGVVSFTDEMLEEQKIRNKQKDFAKELFDGVMEHLEQLDEKLNEFLNEWKIDSLGHLERSILRLGAYEILHTDLDNAVAINEAIVIAKNLCGDTSPRLINGVLDNLAKKFDK